MKRLIVFCLLLAMLACVPTPVEEVVVSKADGAPEQIIHATLAPAPTEQAATMRTSVPEQQAASSPTVIPTSVTHWAERFSVAAALDRLDVEIDADITYPASGTAPVFRIGFSAPEQEQADALISILLGDGPLFLSDRTKTKAFYKVQMERFISEKEKTTDEAELAEWDMLLERAAKDYADAPDELQRIPWDGNTQDGFALMAANGDGTDRYLLANERQISFRDALDAPTFPAVTWKVHTAAESDPEKDAVQFCERILQSLGIEAVFSGILSTQSSVREFGARVQDGYVVYFDPVYGGLPVTSLTQYKGSDDAVEAAGGASEPAYSIPIECESIQAVVSGDHLVSLAYMRPSRIRTVENGAAPLLPLEKVQALFKSDIGKVMFVSKGVPLKLKIHTARLTLQRMPIADNPDELYLVPAWEFVAAVEGNDALQNVCVLHLNALDGSILS